MASKIRVVIADDEAPYRSALRKTLTLMPECEVLGICTDGQEALDVCLADPPDVLLADLNMPRLDGIELIRSLSRQQPDVRVVVLTVREDDEAIFDAFRAGALGYLLKTSTPSEVVEAIRLAHRGEAKITPKIAARVIEGFRGMKAIPEAEEGDAYLLSEREQEILELIASGMRNKEIAQRLGIAEKTVKNHVSNILKALQVNSRTEAAMKAVKGRISSKE